MEKISLQNIPAASLNRKMRDLFQDLIDITMMEANGKGCLKSVPTNYGYVFFWYGYLNKKALQKHYTAYVPKEKVREMRKNKKENPSKLLKDQISEFLFSMVRDHPEIIGEGLAETHLTILAPRLKSATVADAAKALKEYALKLERLEKFKRKYLKKKSGRIVEEIETRFEPVDYVTEPQVKKYGDEYFWDDECGYLELAHKRLGCEIQVRVHFKGEDTLGQVVDRIDGAIEPLKSDLNVMYRFGRPCWPF